MTEDFILDAVQKRSMFNLISMTEGEKVDFWMLTDEPFDQSRFARKREEVVLGMKLKVSVPEDTILAKLRWAKLAGGSEKQFTDALRVYELQHAKLDFPYLEYWTVQLGVESLWQDLKTAAEPI